MSTSSHDYVALVGNDDVPGIHGIADARARQLLEKYDNLEGIYAALDAGTLQEAFPKNIVAALSDNRERTFEMRNSLVGDMPEVAESEVEVETTETEEDEIDIVFESVEDAETEPTSEQVPETDTVSDTRSEDADETAASEDQPTEEAVQTDVVPESDTDSEEAVIDAEPTEDETPDAAPEVEVAESEVEVETTETEEDEIDIVFESVEDAETEPTSEQVPETDTVSDTRSEDADETAASEDQPTEEAVQTDVVPESDTDSEEAVIDAEPTEDETPDAAPEVTEEGLRHLEPLTATLERVGEDAEFAQFTLRLNRTDSHDTVVEVWGNRDSVGFIGKVLRRVGKVVERVVGHAYLFSWSGNWKRGYRCQWGREWYAFHRIIPADHEVSAPFGIARGRNSEIRYRIQSSESDESE